MVVSVRHMTLPAGCSDGQVLLPGLTMLPAELTQVTGLLECPYAESPPHVLHWPTCKTARATAPFSYRPGIVQAHIPYTEWASGPHCHSYCDSLEDKGTDARLTLARHRTILTCQAWKEHGCWLQGLLNRLADTWPRDAAHWLSTTGSPAVQQQEQELKPARNPHP